MQLDISTALIFLHMQVWGDIRLVKGMWYSKQLPDPDSLPVADYMNTG